MAVSIGPKIGIDGEAEYRKQLQNIIQNTKTLDKELSTLGDTFDESTSGMSKHERALELTREKAEKLAEAVDKMRDMVEQSADVTGENSTQTEKWKEKLAEAESQLAKTNSALDDLKSPMGELNDTISEQQDELDELKDAYANAFLAGDSGACEELANRISDVSSELQNNKSLMDEARVSADTFDETMQDVSEAETEVKDAAAAMGSVFGGSIGDIVMAITSGDVVGLMSEIYDSVMEVIDAQNEMLDEFEAGESTIVAGTGAMGDALEDLKEQAEQAWLKIADADGDIGTASDATAELNTRLGLTGDSALTAGQMFLEFAEATGANAVDSVDDVVNAMKTFHEVTGDATTDTATMFETLNMFTTACEDSQLDVNELASAIQNSGSYFQEAGYSMKDMIELMVQYSDAGGNVSTMSSTMRTAIKKLDEAGVDVPSTFKKVISTLEGTGTESEILSTKIDGTSLTIQDLLGRNANEFVNRFKEFGSAAKDFGADLDDCDSALTDTYKGTTQTADGFQMVLNNLQDQTGISADLIGQFVKLGGQYKQIGTLGETAADEIADGFQETMEQTTATADALDKATESTSNLTDESQIYANSIDLMISAENDATQATEELTEEQQEALEQIQATVDSVKSTLSEPLGSTWFDELEEKSAVSSADMVANLQAQIDAMRNWESNLNYLADKGINQELLTYLAEMGPEGSQYVQALVDDVNNNSSAGLDQLNALWQEKFNISNMADEEGQKLVENVGGAATEVQNALSGLGDSYSVTADDINTSTSGMNDNVTSDISAMSDDVETSITSMSDTVKDATASFVEVGRENFSRFATAAEVQMIITKNKVSKQMDAIKALTNFSWSLPNIKIPHFSLSGAFNIEKGTVPTINVSWYKKAYDQAMLLSSPTIFGASNGSLLGGGDGNGSEVVVGENHLLSMMTQAVRAAFGYIPSTAASGSTTNNYAGSTINVYGAPGQDVKELANLVSKQINKQVNIRSAV